MIWPIYLISANGIAKKETGVPARSAGTLCIINLLIYQKFWYTKYMMLGSKDAIRIVPYFVLSQFCPTFAYREVYASLLCSCRGGSLSRKPLLCKHIVVSGFWPQLMPTNCSAAKQLPQFCKHSKSADLLCKSLLSHVWQVPSSKVLSCRHERLFEPSTSFRK